MSKMIKKTFSGQLSGDVKKEKFFAALREEHGIKLPAVGKVGEVALPSEVLDGAFLSMLDGKGALKVNGTPVSKIAVYKGNVEIPEKFSLTLAINRVSDASCKLSATLTGK
jgi:hypothetical protein